MGRSVQENWLIQLGANKVNPFCINLCLMGRFFSISKKGKKKTLSSINFVFIFSIILPSFSTIALLVLIPYNSDSFFSTDSTLFELTEDAKGVTNSIKTAKIPTSSFFCSFYFTYLAFLEINMLVNYINSL